MRNANTGNIKDISAADAAGGTFMSLTIPGVYLNNGPLINTAGDIVGYYKDGIGAYHGFVRAADGTITEFDAPGAGTAESEGTVAAGINATGAIVGSYRDSGNIWHGFIRATDGTFTDINAGAGTAWRPARLHSASTTPAWCAGPMETRAGPPRDLCAPKSGKLTDFKANLQVPAAAKVPGLSSSTTRATLPALCWTMPWWCTGS